MDRLLSSSFTFNLGPNVFSIHYVNNISHSFGIQFFNNFIDGFIELIVDGSSASFLSFISLKMADLLFIKILRKHNGVQ